MQINKTAKSTGTTTKRVTDSPIAWFTMPAFGKKKPHIIYFYTRKEVEKFIKKLPKDWLEAIILGH